MYEELEELREAQQEALAFREAMAENDRAVRVFLSRAGQVHSAYSYALGQVRRELDSLQRSFEGAAASLLGAFSNVLSSIRPALTRLANTVTSVFGVSYWQSSSDALDDTASSLGRVAGATRSVAEAQRQLYGFDRITRVDADRGGSGGGGSGSGGSGGGGVDTGQWVRVPGLLDEIVQNAAEILSQIWDPIDRAWKAQGEQTMIAVTTALAAVGDAAAAVGQSWLKAWTGGAGEEAVRSVLTIVENLANTVGTLAARFTTAWQEAGVGDEIMSRLLSIAQTVLDALVEMSEATARWAKDIDFGPLLTAFNGLLGAIQPLCELLGGALSAAYREVLLPLAAWTINEAMPAAVGTLTAALDLLRGALELLQPAAQFVWENLLKPMGQWTGAGVVQQIQSVTNGFKTLSTALNNLPSGWGTVKSKASSIWGGIATVLKTRADTARKNVVTLFQKMNTSSSGSATSLRKKLDKTFQAIANNARTRFSGLTGALTTPFKNGLNGVVSLANTIIRKLNSTLRLSWPAVRVNGQTVVKPGSARLSNMPTLTPMAAGGVTTGPTLSLIGEAGREAVLPLERNTGWMDELARRLNRGQTVIEVHVGSERLVRQVVDEVNRITARSGVCPIYV